MGGFLEFVKVVAIPALISLALFLSINYLIRPAVRRYRERYEQYLPLHAMSGSIVQHTNTIKNRIGDRIMAYILPRFHIERRASIDNGEELFDHEEAEDMVGFDDIRDIERRREQLRSEVAGMERDRLQRGEEDYGETR